MICQDFTMVFPWFLYHDSNPWFYHDTTTEVFVVLLPEVGTCCYYISKMIIIQDGNLDLNFLTNQKQPVQWTAHNQLGSHRHFQCRSQQQFSALTDSFWRSQS
jgi:hypothetical protein